MRPKESATTSSTFPTRARTSIPSAPGSLSARCVRVHMHVCRACGCVEGWVGDKQPCVRRQKFGLVNAYGTVYWTVRTVCLDFLKPCGSRARRSCNCLVDSTKFDVERTCKGSVFSSQDAPHVPIDAFGTLCSQGLPSKQNTLQRRIVCAATAPSLRSQALPTKKSA